MLIKKKGVTVAQFCDDIGIAKNAMSEWKSGRIKPSIETIVKIAEYFGVSCDYILTGNQDNLTLLNNGNKEEPVSNNKGTQKVIEAQKSVAEELGDAVIETLVKAGKIRPDEQLTPELIESIIKVIDGIATFKT